MEFQQFFDIPAGYRNWWSSEQLPDLPDEAIDVIADARRSRSRPACRSCSASPGAAPCARGAEQSPLAGRDMRFIVHPLFLWENPLDDEQLIDLGRGYRDDLRAVGVGATYLNFNGDEGAGRMSDAYGTSADRLAAVKAAYDPQDVFRTHQAINRIAAS